MTPANPIADFGRDLAPGARVGSGRYILRRALGRGELSEVWLAQDTTAGREVTLKFLPAELFSDADVAKLLEEEVRRNAMLVHPHVATAFEFVRDNYSAAIASEYVDGWSLAARKVDRPQQRYHVEEIEWWIRQLCTALDYAHSEFGILHLDLKPANLLVNGQDELKIADFGIAQLIRNESSRHGLLKGVYSGIGFLSPQQVMGETPSPLDDVYSLGATMFDLLTGTPPFHKGEVVAQICNLPAPGMTERLRELGIKDETLPEVWERTVAACLAKNPAERPQSAVEVQQLLDRIEVAEVVEAPVFVERGAMVEALETPVAPSSDSGETATEVKSQPPKRKAALRLIIVVVAILAAIIGLSALLKSKSDSSATESDSLVSAGALDKSFNPGAGADDDIRAVAIQSDGKIILGGRFTHFDGVSVRHIVRLNPDGSLDQTFSPQPRGMVHAVTLQGDGKILIGGESMAVDGHPRRRVVRLNASGAVEEDFGSKVNYDREVRAIAVQPDGKVLVGGSFTQVLNSPQNRIVRLNHDGSRDETFNVDNGASAIVWSIAVQPDGKILVGGGFTSFNGAPAGRVVRLNRDGGVDSSFNAGTGADATVSAVAVQSDGKLLVAGDFRSVNGVTRQHIARLNRDGNVDAGFDPGVGPDGQARSVAVQPDGKVIIGGSFSTLGGEMCRGVARLNADGSTDKSFNIGGGASGSVWRVALQQDGKILVGGVFPSFDGVACGGVARLLGK